jgi:hypothetical protein
MKFIISIPFEIERLVREHLFQNDLEQSAFLMANSILHKNQLVLNVVDTYLVPKEGWQVQHNLYLEMKDSERAKIMNIARLGGYAVIDCHSHPDSNSQVWFSPSDQYGITDFAAYAKWKLGNKPFAAMVWGEASLDAVVWWGDFKKPYIVNEVRIKGETVESIKPQRSWNIIEPKPWWMEKKL